MTENTDDRYQRTGATGIDDAAGAVEIDFETLGYPKEWWDKRDREVKAQLEQAATELEKSRVLKRAGDLRDNGFPERFVAAAMGELEETTAMKAARTFRYMSKRIIVFGGGVGAGKTTAATYIALQANDPRPGFVRVNELARHGSFGKNNNLDEILRKSSLVIDDLGAEYLDGKGAFRAVMDEIVDVFYADRRTLVFTTNLKPMRDNPDEQEQLFERYGERVWSRLNQSGLWVGCGNTDMRAGKADE